ncbi:MAG TPA: hypothetical protein VF615_12705 [Longimicrobiaceae bacterium]|jgi:hypothetical protein
MNTRIAAPLLLGAALACAAAPLAAQAPGSRAVFRVTLPAGDSLTGGAPVSGRLLVMMSRTRPASAEQPLAPGLDPEEVWVAAREVTGLRPGGSVVVDADSLAAPRPFSRMPAGRRWVMALLDADHNANWSTFTPGDLVSPVDSADAAGTRAASTELVLRHRIPSRPLPALDTAAVKVVELASPLLSTFWKRPVVLRMSVHLPPDSEAVSTPEGPRFRAVYHVPGWGASLRTGLTYGREQVAKMREGGERGAVHVFFEPGFPTGHPVFANSANNGPWADALVREVIPHLERRFGLIPDARARFLTGHSSGGWATLWLQVSRPDFFGGTWSTTPDLPDFSDFQGVDVRPGSRDNFFRAADGRPRPFARVGGRDVGSLEDAARLEAVLGPGGQLASFEAVFGPRGRDGRPVPLFDRATGRMDPAVQRAWAAYDIRALLERDRATLLPRLRGKLHVLAGGSDTFHLEGSTAKLCAFLRGAGSDAVCEIVPGRGHFDLQQPFDTYPHGLEHRFGAEMQRTFDASWRSTP